MMHLDESLMGPLCKVTSALALASALGLAGCGGGASSASSLSIMLLAAKDAATGFELWKTDGTANGTSLVKDINLGAGNSFPGGGGTPFPSEFVFFNGFWFFSADDGTGPKLWKSDGTQAMLVTAAVSSPRELTVLGNALYFSRAPIPWVRDAAGHIVVRHWKHLGLYVFQRDALLEYATLPQGDLERIEQLEQLRWMENGVKIRVAEVEHDAVSVDVPEDVARVEKLLQS